MDSGSAPPGVSLPEGTDDLDAEARELARRGDARAAAERLLEAHGAVVHTFCLNWTGDEARSGEICRRVFLRAHERLGWLSVEGSPRGILLRIARNLLLDDLDRQAVHGRLIPREPGSGDPSPPDPAALATDRRARERVEEGLDLLLPDERALLLSRFRDGISDTDLMAAFGEDEDGLADRLRTALARLLRSLARTLPSSGLDPCPEALEDLLEGDAAEGPTADAWTQVGRIVLELVSDLPGAASPAERDYDMTRRSIADAHDRPDPEARTIQAVAKQIRDRHARAHRGSRPPATDPGVGPAAARGTLSRVVHRVTRSPVLLAVVAGGVGMLAVLLVVLAIAFLHR